MALIKFMLCPYANLIYWEIKVQVKPLVNWMFCVHGNEISCYGVGLFILDSLTWLYILCIRIILPGRWAIYTGTWQGELISWITKTLPTLLIYFGRNMSSWLKNIKSMCFFLLGRLWSSLNAEPFSVSLIHSLALDT